MKKGKAKGQNDTAEAMTKKKSGKNIPYKSKRTTSLKERVSRSGEKDNATWNGQFASTSSGNTKQTMKISKCGFSKMKMDPG